MKPRTTVPILNQGNSEDSQRGLKDINNIFKGSSWMKKHV